MDPKGLKTAVEMLGGAAVMDRGGEQPSMFDDEPVGGPLTPASSGPKGGRPRGARNRSTEEWRQFFVGKYGSPLLVLGEIYSRTPADLARELRLFKGIRVAVTEGDRVVMRDGEDEGALDLEAAFRLQLAALETVLPYVHQKQPMAVEVKNEETAVLVIGTLQPAQQQQLGQFALPIVEDKENQRVTDAEIVQSDASQSDAVANQLRHNDDL